MKNLRISDSKKILIIYILLFISNLALWYFLLDFTFEKVLRFNINYIGNYFTIASVFIIFGFISSRLPRLRAMGDSSLYEIGYLLIMGLVGLIVSYFNGVVNDNFVLEPFIEMFNVLAIVLIIMIFSTRLKSVKAMIRRDYTRNDVIVCLIVFLVVGILSTLLTKNLGHSSANVRTMTVMIAGMFGGPVIGIPTAVVATVIRFFMGGPTALPCAVSTMICGFVARAIYIWNGKRFLRTTQSAILMFLFIGFEMLAIIIALPNRVAIPIVLEIYAPMTFVAVIGIILFKLVIAETRRKVDDTPVDPKEELANLKKSLAEYEEKINVLEDKINNESEE